MAPAANVIYQFDKFQLDPVQGWLARDGVVVDLPSKTLAVLIVLVQNAGHVVEPRELMAKAWPGERADEAKLNVQISALRTILRDTDSRFIVTIPGKGIRFVQPTDEFVVDRRPETPPAPAAPEPEASTPSLRPASKSVIAGVILIAVCIAGFFAWRLVRSSGLGNLTDDSSGGPLGDSPIAVLPIRSGGEGIDQQTNDKLTEAVISRLSKVSGISILPMKTVSKYHGASLDPTAAANELGAGSVVTVFIQKLGMRGRVTVQMVNPRSRKEEWSEAFDTDFTGLEDQISQRISQHVTAAQ